MILLPWADKVNKKLAFYRNNRNDIDLTTSLVLLAPCSLSLSRPEPPPLKHLLYPRIHLFKPLLSPLSLIAGRTGLGEAVSRGRKDVVSSSNSRMEISFIW